MSITLPLESAPFVLSSVNLIITLLVHLILRVSPYHSDTFPPLLSLSITPSAFYLVCLHGSWTWTGLSGHWRFNIFIFLFLVTCARLSWPQLFSLR